MPDRLQPTFNEYNLKPLQRKLLVVGDGACGKTSLLYRYDFNSPPEDSMPSCFEDHKSKEVNVGGRSVQLILWDTAGLEDPEDVRREAYAGVNVILIAFALNEPQSLRSVQDTWIEEVRDRYQSQAPIILVGCKSDLRAYGEPNELVQASDAQRVADAIGASTYKECSANTAEGMEELFKEVAYLSIRDYAGPSAVNPRQPSKPQSRRFRCCIF